MNRVVAILSFFVLLLSCNREDNVDTLPFDNPEISFEIPKGFPEFNAAVTQNKPTKFGVALGERLFHETKLSGNNTISCASCHHQDKAFADHLPQAVGIHGRVGLRNTPPLQNLAFMKFYNWDGNKLSLESQALVPIITHEEMNSSILDVIGKLQTDPEYRHLFEQTFGDEGITADRIYRSLAQYQYTLISADSKYDKVMRGEGEFFTKSEERGYQIFQQKCESCHATPLFTDQTFRNIGFPLNPNIEEAGRARVTGNITDLSSFRIPSLRNAALTAPYGSFGQFETLQAVLDYLDEGVLESDNLDPILKANGNRIPLSKQEKVDIISFINTLTDSSFIAR